MIFENINIIQSNKTEKSFFIEKIHIINELISKYCSKNKIKYSEIISDIEISIKELKLIGIIKQEKQIENILAQLNKIHEDSSDEKVNNILEEVKKELNCLV